MTSFKSVVAEDSPEAKDEMLGIEKRDLDKQSPALLVSVPIDQIRPYERNPRQVPNPEFDRIKDSIRRQGLDQPLVITQRPNSEDYIVHSGGNTRLSVLKALYDETGDERFSHAQCVLKPWHCESEVLLAHLRENDLRGNLSFIDKARAVCDARSLLAKELGLQEITQQRLETELRQAGYSVSQGLISQMDYAVTRLMPLIPIALNEGLGRPQVTRIRTLEKAARNVWDNQCTDEPDAFEEIFAALCHRYDGQEWEIGLLHEALENEIAETAEISIQTVRVLFDAEIAGRQVIIPEPEPEIEVPEADLHESRITNERGLEEADHIESSTESIMEEQLERQDSVAFPDGVPEPSEENETAEPSQLPNLFTSSETVPTDLKSLRGRAWTLAARLAQRHGLGELVEPLSGKGLGYLLRDVPDPSLAEQLDEESLSQLSMLWWQLAACAEMTFAPLESILPLLPSDSILRRSLETEDADLLFSSIWTLDPGHTGYRLWRKLDDRDWQDLIHLMDTYRQIRRSAADNGTAIWE